MRRIPSLVLIALLLAAPAHAAPIVRGVQITLSFGTGQLNGSLSVSAPGTVTVDEAAGTVVVPSLVVLSTTQPVTAPVSVTTTFFSPRWAASKLGLAGGTLRFGGATTQAGPGEGPCPESGAFVACVNGGGLGGQVGMTGTLNLELLPGVVTIPFDLASNFFGVTGSASGAFLGDGAPFTTGTAQVSSASLLATAQGGIDFLNDAISLVAPTYYHCCALTFDHFTMLTITFTDGGGLPSFVPEPGPLAMIACGVVGLAALRRRSD